MAYQALYRTYRPQHFCDVIGQDHVVRTLLNSVKQDKVGHAYLFSGPRGTGKTTVARLLARAINCPSPVDGEPCDKCERCKGSEKGLGVLEIDAASHGSVDDMRQLVAQVSQVPLSGGMMVYIIDEVHMLSKEAFNAFLKTLEEPPPHAVFVLATTEPGKLLPTIHSRCQHFSFHRIPIAIIAGHIEKICGNENIPADEAAIKLIARAADGSVRDSISILEQAIAYEPHGLTLQGVRDVLGIPDRMDIRRLGAHIIACDPGKLSESFAGLIESGREPLSILSGLLLHFRDILFAALDLDHADLKILPDEEISEVRKQAEGLNADDVHKAITFLGRCERDIKWEDEAALILEVSLFRLATRFGSGPATEQPRKTAPESLAEAPPLEAFPDARPAPAIETPEETADQPLRKNLTGGRSLKRKKTPSEMVQPPAPPVTPDKKESAKERSKPPAPDKTITLNPPDDIDPIWKNALESIREVSIAEYILLALAVPSPPPAEWPDASAEKTLLQLTLRYPFGRGLLVKLVNEPGVLNLINSRLEEVLERPIELRVAQSRGEMESDAVGTPDIGGRMQSGMVDGGGQVTGVPESNGPSLFPGAGRPIPTDPELKKIHHLIVDDFPDYDIEQGTEV